MKPALPLEQLALCGGNPVSGVVVEGAFDVTWKCGKTPQEWREAIVVPTCLHEGL